MNVYDFDETIFEGDCEDRFFKYLSGLAGFRFSRLRYLLLELISKKMKLMSRTTARQIQYSFLKRIPDIDSVLEAYWDSSQKFMKKWYFDVQKPDDVIASGTPGFLLAPMIRRLKITGCISTKMDKHSGKIDGFFAVGRYKLEYFEEQFDSSEIDKFYSDSFLDHFLAEKAKKAYFIHGKNHDQFSDWNDYFRTHRHKCRI